MSNTPYFPEYKTVKIGVMRASPDGDEFKALFENFSIKHLPNERRLEWLENNIDSKEITPQDISQSQRNIRPILRNHNDLDRRYL